MDLLGWLGLTGASCAAVRMSEAIRAVDLLREAAQMYDSEQSRLSVAARDAWRTGFVSGGEWMVLALSEMRGVPPALTPPNLQALGIIKYSLACAAALLVIGIALWTGIEPLALLCIPAFYAVEVQMVFLFPIVLDGYTHPFRESRKWTVVQGGTLSAMKVVMPLAAVMIFGGFLGQGFIRSWCLGCLAVVLWYEKLRQKVSESSNADAIVQ